MLVRSLLSFAPVLLFLLGLWALDSYKLLRPAVLLRSVVAGGLASIASYFLAQLFLGQLGLPQYLLVRYVAPLYEEALKALVVVWAIRSRRVGFMVDAAILGFAVGTGFATAENLYYLRSLGDAGLALFAVRGFGTAILHGSTTAIFAILAKALDEASGENRASAYLPALALAYVVHSGFNHVVLPPALSTALLLVALPPLLWAVFRRSERLLRKWLEVGLGSDVELLAMLRSGEISTTRIGEYLRSLRGRFPGEVLADMLCYLQLRVELSIKAKGALLLKEAGLQPPPDPEVPARLDELEILERNLGTTGRLALSPLLNFTDRDLWQLRLLDTRGRRSSS